MFNSQKVSKVLFVRKHLCFGLSTVIICAIVTIYYIKKDYAPIPNPAVEFRLEPSVNNLSCHFLLEGDVLPSAESAKFSPKANSIFFHETSCRGGLTLRQACSIESAARAHPTRQVYVLFSVPIKEHVLHNSCLAKLALISNVQLVRIHLKEYALNTPLEEMMARNPFTESKWWIEHTSDILRYLTLYKWGGLYLDTDMIVVKSLSSLGPNWLSREDSTLINSAAIALSMDNLGREIANALMSEVKTTYRPDLWLYNGPGAITRILYKRCSGPDMNKWSSKTCQGIEVYGPEYFYPIHYSIDGRYFKPGNIDQYSKKAVSYHMWNKLTHNMKIEPGSPYSRIAEKHCPTIFEAYREHFGA